MSSEWFTTIYDRKPFIIQIDIGEDEMPLKPGKSKEVVDANISELVTSKPGKARAKGIKTLAKRRGISEKVAKRKQAVAIAKSKAEKSKRKKNPANNLKPKGTAMERFAISRGAKRPKNRKKKK